MTPEQADALVDSPAAYVHIPFCSAVCPYCDFAVVASRDDLALRYIDAVVTEISRSQAWRPLEAVYFGGGTPSQVEPALLGQVLAALSKKHGVRSDAEVSLEANPEDFDARRAIELREIGFNRVSFGAQSFDPTVLDALGRRHSPRQIELAVSTARAAGFTNISIDLIYGTPSETDESWRRSLEMVTQAAIDHVSCYSLTVEPGTPLAKSVALGSPAPDHDVQAERFGMAVESLEQQRYEVSNWAAEGHQCRYNMTVWAQGEYEAYGNGAHGFRSGRRFRNARRLGTYLERIEGGVSAQAGVEPMSEWELEIDRLFVGLRRVVGVAHGHGTRWLLDSDEGRRLLDAGVIVDDGRLRVAEPMLTDAVFRSVLSLKPPIVSAHQHA